MFNNTRHSNHGSFFIFSPDSIEGLPSRGNEEGGGAISMFLQNVSLFRSGSRTPPPSGPCLSGLTIFGAEQVFAFMRVSDI